MLIIGDVATKKYKPDHRINNIEIIYQDDDELNYIKHIYKLDHLVNNTGSVRIYTRDNLIYKLYNMRSLDKIMAKYVTNNFSWKYEKKIINPFHNYILESLRLSFLHPSVENWDRRMKGLMFLQNEFVMPLIAYDDKFNDNIDRDHKLLNKFLFSQIDLVSTPYIYKEYEKKVKLRDLVAIVSREFVNYSKFYRIVDQFDETLLSENKFDFYAESEKMTACVESLYVDTLSQYVIPYIKEKKKEVSDLKLYEFFKQSIMNRISSHRNRWFGKYMLQNYDKLLDKYDVKFHDSFKEALYSKLYFLGQNLEVH